MIGDSGGGGLAPEPWAFAREYRIAVLVVNRKSAVCSVTCKRGHSQRQFQGTRDAAWSALTLSLDTNSQRDRETVGRSICRRMPQNAANSHRQPHSAAQKQKRAS